MLPSHWLVSSNFRAADCCSSAVGRPLLLSSGILSDVAATTCERHQACVRSSDVGLYWPTSTPRSERQNVRYIHYRNLKRTQHCTILPIYHKCERIQNARTHSRAECTTHPAWIVVIPHICVLYIVEIPQRWMQSLAAHILTLITKLAAMLTTQQPTNRD